MQIRLQLITVPDEAKSVPLGQNRKHGCPTKWHKALLIQSILVAQLVNILTLLLHF